MIREKPRKALSGYIVFVVLLLLNLMWLKQLLLLQLLRLKHFLLLRLLLLLLLKHTSLLLRLHHHRFRWHRLNLIASCVLRLELFITESSSDA